MPQVLHREGGIHVVAVEAVEYPAGTVYVHVVLSGIVYRSKSHTPQVVLADDEVSICVVTPAEKGTKLRCIVINCSLCIQHFCRGMATIKSINLVFIVLCI